MSRSIITKFFAFVLAALTLVAAAASLLSIAVLSYQGLYDSSLEEVWYGNMEDYGEFMASCFAERYAAEHLGNCPENVLDQLYGAGFNIPESSWSISLVLDGETLTQTGDIPNDAYEFEYIITGTYPSMIPPEGSDSRQKSDPTAATTVTQEYESEVRTSTWEVWKNGEWVEYTLYLYDTPEYTVTVHLKPEAFESNSWTLLQLMYEKRYQLIVYGAVSLLIFAACAVYLCCAAGRAPGSSEVRPGGLNRLPLDLYALIAGGFGILVSWVGIELAEWGFSDEVNYGVLILEGILAMVLSLLIVAFCFALAAQLKARRGYWWRNSVIGRVLLFIWRCTRWFFRGIIQLSALLPVIWQWLLTAAVMAVSLVFTFLLAVNFDDFFVLLFFLTAVLCVGIVCYGGYAFGTLLSGVIKMNRGDLDHKIPTKYLIGSFRDFAVALNGLSESAMVAAKNQLKSERMKTELITNVSHDIKTPLTSIINYVDLLQKPHSEEEQRMYLEVLSRQSLRLKKLIDDLMEMSKASTGNLTVEISQIDAGEAINQALGEFSGKLANARLIPVFNAPAEPTVMLADGRLVWRVLSNLLGNAVKYALPGTRVYIDTAKAGGQVMISIKNVSKEQLNVSSEELMERFVRGDASRNTEGSGLGLNIAKSLMEVQKGQLSLLVDGDLFKVTLFFPAA